MPSTLSELSVAGVAPVGIRTVADRELEDIDIPPFDPIFDDAGGRPNPRCDWDYSVCLETPSHCAIWADPETGRVSK